MIARTTVAALCLIAAATMGCRSESKADKSHGSPAKVEKAPVETEIGRITLEPKATERLGITTVPVTKEAVDRRRVLPGELMIPPGRTIVVTAQVPGTIQPPASGPIPLPGSSLAAGDAVLRLAPLLSPERYVPTPAERVQMANARATLMGALTVAKGDVDRGTAEVEGARIAKERAERLFADRAGAERAVDDAKAQFSIATASLDAATQRADELEQMIKTLAGDAPQSADDATTMTIRAPQVGILRSLSVSEGQAVSAGSPLFDVVDPRTMWVRVPVYIGMLDEIRSEADLRIVGLDGNAAEFTRAAKPIAAPPTADPLNTTADLYFEVENADGSLKPGERVGAEVREGASESLVVPAAAILYDIYGGTWVYVEVVENAFERRRVAVRFVETDRAVLAEGPAPETPVVVDGAAELFGTEFGAGK